MIAGAAMAFKLSVSVVMNALAACPPGPPLRRRWLERQLGGGAAHDPRFLLAVGLP